MGTVGSFTNLIKRSEYLAGTRPGFACMAGQSGESIAGKLQTGSIVLGF